MLDPRNSLIVALDVPTVDDARRLVRRLDHSCSFYKVGLELVMSGGIGFVEELRREGNKVFLDMKLLDISNTVERATANAAALGATFLTVHGHDLKTLRAAEAGRAGSALKLLAVTVLTNLTREDLRQQRVDSDPSELVLHRARMAQDAGFDGVVASGHEARSIREELGQNLIIVTPGIRLAGGVAGDQERTMTPERAIAAGANFLVVGRPIIEASDPKVAADEVTEQIRRAAESLF